MNEEICILDKFRTAFAEFSENMTRHRIRVPRRALRRASLLLRAACVTFRREVPA
jgi:hypothetical protein